VPSGPGTAAREKVWVRRVSVKSKVIVFNNFLGSIGKKRYFSLFYSLSTRTLLPLRKAGTV
jgi:hypothetical protein